MVKGRSEWGGGSGEEGVGRRECGGGDKSTSLLPSPQARDNFLGRQYLHFDLLTPGNSKKWLVYYYVLRSFNVISRPVHAK